MIFKKDRMKNTIIPNNTGTFSCCFIINATGSSVTHSSGCVCPSTVVTLQGDIFTSLWNFVFGRLVTM